MNKSFFPNNDNPNHIIFIGEGLGFYVYFIQNYYSLPKQEKTI